MYDCTYEGSAMNIPSWVDRVQRYCGDMPACLLVGNKCDQEGDQEVSTEVGLRLAEGNDARIKSRTRHCIE